MKRFDPWFHSFPPDFDNSHFCANTQSMEQRCRSVLDLKSDLFFVYWWLVSCFRHITNKKKSLSLTYSFIKAGKCVFTLVCLDFIIIGNTFPTHVENWTLRLESGWRRRWEKIYNLFKTFYFKKSLMCKCHGGLVIWIIYIFDIYFKYL